LPAPAAHRIILAMTRKFRSLIVIATLMASTGLAAAAVKATYSATRFVLELAGSPVNISAASGLGFAKSSSQNKGASAATPASVDIRYPVDTQSEGFARVVSFLGGTTTPFDATLKVIDMNNGIKQLFELGQASITELELPGASAKDSKKALEFRLRLQPSKFNVVPGSGTQAATATGKTKALLSSNFRVSVDGVASASVMTVAPCIVKKGGREITGLAVTVPLNDGVSGDWWKWAQGSLASKDVKASEKVLRVEYLDPSLTNVLLTVDFNGTSVETMDIASLEANADQVLDVSFGLSARSVQIR
jgi:hypothetical protein